MSLVISWVAKDNHGFSSVYLASDSRANSNNKKFDSCRKIFYSKNYPEIIGYCGDVLFPSMIINSLIDMMDNNLLFSINNSPKERY
jgi:hypothetical protein